MKINTLNERDNFLAFPYLCLMCLDVVTVFAKMCSLEHFAAIYSTSVQMNNDDDWEMISRHTSGSSSFFEIMKSEDISDDELVSQDHEGANVVENILTVEKVKYDELYRSSLLAMVASGKIKIRLTNDIGDLHSKWMGGHFMFGLLNHNIILTTDKDDDKYNNDIRDSTKIEKSKPDNEHLLSDVLEESEHSDWDGGSQYFDVERKIEKEFRI